RGRRDRRRDRRVRGHRTRRPRRRRRRGEGAGAGPRDPRAAAPHAGRRGRCGRSGMRLADLTTLRIGGENRNLVEARTADEVIAAVSAADEAGEPLLVLGGGSNLVASDEPFEGTVVLLRDREDPPLLDAT